MIPKFKLYFQYVEPKITEACEGFNLVVSFSGVNKHLIISLLIYQIKYTLIKI